MKNRLISTPWSLLFIVLFHLQILNVNSVRGQHLTFNAYTGQSEISASGSITFTNGFTVPAGNNLRAYISASANCVPLASAASSNQNYVVSSIVKRPGIIDADNLASLNVCELNQSIQYLDGLGRPLQTVQVKGSPTLKDIVQPVSYDAFGREVIKYLSYADAGTANGSYKANALSAGQGVLSFYNPAGSSGTQQTNGVVRTVYPFSKTIFEPSPLNRVLELGAPGTAWQPATSRTTSGRTVVREYGSNAGTGAEAVKLWVITANGASCGTNIYAANKLYKTTIKDENWTAGKIGTVDEYKDFEGHVVLKRIWESETVSLSTYYIYDDLGNLKYVIPPAVTATSFTTVATDLPFSQFIYAYNYDGRQRMIEKKVPGKDWEYLVYNILDQVVLTQDGVQRNKANQSWTATKYDAYGHVIMTGIHTYGVAANTNYRSAIQLLVDAQANQWEIKDPAGIGYTINRTYPTVALNPVLSIQYYDDYTAPGMPVPYSLGANATYSSKLKGLPTASKVNVLGTSEMLWTVNYYDNEARIVKSYKQHYQKGAVDTANYDKISNTYSFIGELLSSIREHRNTGAITTIINTYEYDHMGRKKLVKEKINAGAEVVLSRLNYNEVGQVLKKELHSTDSGSTFLQNTQYTYNERGWLKTGTSAQFSNRLKYEDGTSPQYNGNIANQDWGAAASLPNVYTYSYDRLNRLLSGTSTGIVMSEVLSYDVMGNIKTMNRDAAGTASTYNYTGNRLTNITGGALATGNYSYDVNGNTITDGRTGVVLTYNLLNLPATATRTTPAPVVNLAYTYDATGNKLRKVSTGASVGTRHYVDGIEYNGNTIEVIQTEEGLARNNTGVFSYEYNLSDHLGNVRYTFNQHPTTKVIQRLQADNYYAFGKGKSVQVGTNKYLYNGKEIQDELGEQYDYGARFYDPVVGRWNVIDPLAEEMRRYSPYNYTLNNPIRFIDPDGMDVAEIDGGRAPSDKEPENKIPAGEEDPEKKLKVLENGDLDGGKLKGVTITAKRIPVGTAYQNIVERGEDPFSGPRRYEMRAWHSGQVWGNSWGHDNPLQDAVYDAATFYATGEIGGVVVKGLWNFGKGAYLGRLATKTSTQGGLNLFKFGSKEATSSTGWKSGDRFLKMFDQGSPKLNWKQNSGFLRREMGAGKPIFDSYRLPSGNLIPTGGFLNAERNLLQSRGWIYSPGQGAWLPPGF